MYVNEYLTEGRFYLINMLQLHWLANVELHAGKGEKDAENGKALELKNRETKL